MQRAADFLDHAHMTERVGVANTVIPCIKLRGKNKPFHRSAGDDLVFFGTGKNLNGTCLTYLKLVLLWTHMLVQIP